MGLSSVGGSPNTSFNGNDRTRFDHMDSGGGGSAGGGGSGNDSPTNGFDDGSKRLLTKRLLSLRNHNIVPAAPSQPAVTVMDSSKSNPNWNYRFTQSHTIFSLIFSAGKRFDRSSIPAYNMIPSRTSRYLNDSSRLSNLSRDYSFAYQAKQNQSNTQKYGDAATQPFSIRTVFSSFFSRFNERCGVKQSLVPCILVTALFIFFAGVIIAYLTMNPDLSLALDAKAATYKVCPSSEIGFSTIQPTVNCIEASELEPAFNLLKVLIPELQKRIEFQRCTDPSAAFAMSAKEVVQFLLESGRHSVVETIRTLHNAEYLIDQNPQWRVVHFRDSSGQPTSAITLNEVSRLRSAQSNYYAIVKPRLPVACFLYNKLQLVFIIIGWIGVAALAIYSLIFGVRYIRNHLRTRRERLNNMIEDITNVLMEKAYDPDTASTEAASVVINHLRDKLILPSERSKMESVWNAAIKYLEQNESRIQFSVATRNGEDYRVMRWIDTTSHGQQNSIGLSVSGGAVTAGGSGGANSIGCDSTSASPIGALRTSIGAHANVKKWQSPAFDKTNKIKDPPTECLKIRQMFEKYEASNPNLKQIIQDAILEKVAHTTCKIYDIQLEKQTCCVYVRCASYKDAGLIHDEVNGWWFDSRLVSIKFLRLDRYLARFPNAASGPTCLKPSNTRNLSMTNSEDKRNGKRSADDIYDDDDDDDD